ncbi:hypothetical protein TIFTF001_024503 [Ficus carica]|uniref:Glycosyltransferase n=1 Tax=Ficus carica TaxID=3494 RepID=A0AA88ALH9_FICCA|nr:hypothetical protein TIFTF001_024503 [Ficus carica]
MSNNKAHEDHQYASNRLTPTQGVVVVIVPFPAQGHLNQLLQLSRHVATRGIPVHFVGTATHNRQAKVRVHGWNPNSLSNIHYHDIANIPPFLSPPPNPTNSTTNFPCHLLPSAHATRHLREPTAALLHRLSSEARRVVVVHDSLMAYVVQDVASFENAESFAFQSVSAFTVSMFFKDVMGKAIEPLEHEANVKIPEHVPSIEGCFTREVVDFLESQSQFDELSSGYLFNTSRVIEKPYMDLLDKILVSKKNWAIGPFNPVELVEKKVSNDRHMCLEWLDEQAPRSVVYVSFGTSTTFTDEQIEELALGLEQSEQKFIWVLRESDRGDVFGEVRKLELPKGYEERVRNLGIVVRDWVPQLEILGHRSTGGFLSHCGWNSCMESITMGVPIGAWPMHSDQPRNAVLVTAVLGIGTVVRDWNRRGELAMASTIAEGVRRLMASKEGEEMRKRAEELGGAVRKSVGEGEVSRLELDSFIAHITR